mmetsp:Transcript_46944/g.132057  ORF Transcript_46944/g.132057 Transcript_46944/m.132057 type:complete len:227 (+) Transcript_46944:583-1263(+)
MLVNACTLPCWFLAKSFTASVSDDCASCAISRTPNAPWPRTPWMRRSPTTEPAWTSVERSGSTGGRTWGIQRSSSSDQTSSALSRRISLSCFCKATRLSARWSSHRHWACFNRRIAIKTARCVSSASPTFKMTSSRPSSWRRFCAADTDARASSAALLFELPPEDADVISASLGQESSAMTGGTITSPSSRCASRDDRRVSKKAPTFSTCCMSISSTMASQFRSNS